MMSLFNFKNSSNINKINNDRTAQLRIQTLNDMVLNLRKNNEQLNSEMQDVQKKIKSFCFNILISEIAQQELSGQNFISQMNIYQLLDYTTEKYKEKLDEQKNILSNLLKRIKEQEAAIDALKTELSRHTAKEKVLIENAFEEPKKNEVPGKDKEAENADHGKDSSKADTAVAFVVEDEEMEVLPSSTEPKGNEKPGYEPKDNKLEIKQKEEKKTKNRIKKDNKHEFQKLKDPGKSEDTNIDVKELIDNITDVMWIILSAIGKFGYSESKDIKNFTINKGVTESAFNNALTQLRKLNILEEEKINTGWRWFYSYECSKSGEKLFLEKFKKDVLLCEKQKLKRENSTSLHGYCIKDTANILKTYNGYETVSIEREKNTIKLYNGTSYIPDVIAAKKEGTVVDYFEVELGHHTQHDFNDKCNKMRLITKQLFFIVPDIGTMKKIESQVNRWAEESGGAEKLKGISVYITTTSKLIDGKYDTIIPF